VERRDTEVTGPAWRWGLAFFGFALMLVALLPPGNVTLDGDSMLQVSRSIVNGHGLKVACGDYTVHGRGGACYSTFYPLQSILAVPMIALGHVVGALVNGPRTFVGNLLAQLVPALAAAGTAVFTIDFTQRLGASRARAILAGASVVFATEIAIYSRTFYAESLAAFLTCLLVWGFLRSDRWRIFAPVGIALLILAKPELVLVGLVVGALLAWRERRRRPLVEALAGTAVGTLLYGLYNFARFSNPTNFGGEDRQLHLSAFVPWKVAKVIAEFGVSPGRGFIWYSPIVILGLYAAWKRRSETLALIAFAVLAATLLLYIGNPGEGTNWGDRYLSPAIPLFAAFAWSFNARRALAPALALIGLVIALPTFAGFYTRYFGEQADKGVPNSHLYWSLTRAPIFGVWGSTVREVNTARHSDVYAVAHGPSPPLRKTGVRVSDVRFYKVVNQWWWMTPAAKVPRVIGLLAAIAMFGLGLLLLRRSTSTTRRLA
jgi:hypothetical protein